MREPRYIKLWLRYRAQGTETMGQRHREVMQKMAQIGPPLGFSGLPLPPAPDESRHLSLSYKVELRPMTPVPLVHRPEDYQIKCEGVYIYRGRASLSQDRAHNDDILWFAFTSYEEVLQAINYPTLLQEHFPKVIEAFQAYRGSMSFTPLYYQGSFYEDHYYQGSDGDDYRSDALGNPLYDRLKQDSSLDIDGRNNIYTLHPAQYWDAELCHRGLGYSPQEVITRLQGKVPRVQPLMDGVYLVLNEEPQLTYAEFLKMNETYKPLLGLD